MDIETLVVGFISGVIAGIMLLVGTWVFLLPKIPVIMVSILRDGKKPSSWFERRVYSMWESYQKIKDKGREKDEEK